MAGSIVCGVDNSESAKEAARVARRLSSELGLGLVFVRVVEAGPNDKTVNAVAERLECLTDSATEVDCGAAWLVDVGESADRLVAAATETDASMIVLGLHGARSSLLGSVAAEVSKRAPCPVLVVPPGACSALSGGVARSALESSHQMGHSNVVGGIVRFNLGSGLQLKWSNGVRSDHPLGERGRGESGRKGT